MTCCHDSPQERDPVSMWSRFVISAAATLPLAFVVMMRHFWSISWWTPFQEGLFEMCLASVVMGVGGDPLLRKGWSSLHTRQWNMFTLVSLGILTAYIYSLLALFFPTWFPVSMQHARVPLYFESASMIVTLVLLGQILEKRMIDKTSRSILDLMSLSPKTACVVDANGQEERVRVEKVTEGMCLRVRPGEAVPVDGVLLEGRGWIDASMVTGEMGFVEKNKGEAVIGGTLNHTSSFLMEAQRVGRRTLLSQIVSMVEQAQKREPAPIQRFVDQVSSYFVPFVVCFALGTALFWLLVGQEFSSSLVHAVSVLLIACPCALGLATPMSMMVGMGQGAHMGVLMRDGKSLELMERVDVLVVDKTGTLTDGRPRVCGMAVVEGMSRERALQYAASLGQGSEHPLAKSLVAYASAHEVEGTGVEAFASVVGQGVRGRVEGRECVMGHVDFLQGLGIEVSWNRGIDTGETQDVASWVYLAVDHRVVAVFTLVDQIKESSKPALDALRARGVDVVMLTGDRQEVAESVARELEIATFRAQLLPQDKIAWVEQAQQHGHVVAMAGDGVNDAPALAQSDIGIAMASGTDLAMQSAKMTLIRSDLWGIVQARMLSRATMRNVRQNVYFSFAYNVLALPVAAGVLVPFGISFTPVIASVAMTLSSLTVVINALRLQRLGTSVRHVGDVV